MSNTIENIFFTWAIIACMMFVLWLQQLKSKNAGIVDVAWAYMTGICAAVLVVLIEEGLQERKLLLAGMALIWGTRLGTFLLLRVAGKPEDGRYHYLRNYCGQKANLVMFIFFQLQASWVILFSIPYVAAAMSTSASLTVLDLIGVIVWLVAIVGEVLADQQLANFKDNPDNRGKVCNVGLWRLSRHPNYFFEWLTWVAFVFIGFSSSWWWLTITGVIVMYVFITRFTGIPYTEQQSIRTRGDAYREYQKTTSTFFLLPPRAGES